MSVGCDATVHYVRNVTYLALSIMNVSACHRAMWRFSATAELLILNCRQRPLHITAHVEAWRRLLFVRTIADACDCVFPISLYLSVFLFYWMEVKFNIHKLRYASNSTVLPLQLTIILLRQFYTFKIFESYCKSAKLFRQSSFLWKVMQQYQLKNWQNLY